LQKRKKRSNMLTMKKKKYKNGVGTPFDAAKSALTWLGQKGSEFNEQWRDNEVPLRNKLDFMGLNPVYSPIAPALGLTLGAAGKAYDYLTEKGAPRFNRTIEPFNPIFDAPDGLSMRKGGQIGVNALGDMTKKVPKGKTAVNASMQNTPYIRLGDSAPMQASYQPITPFSMNKYPEGGTIPKGSALTQVKEKRSNWDPDGAVSFMGPSGNFLLNAGMLALTNPIGLAANIGKDIYDYAGGRTRTAYGMQETTRSHPNQAAIDYWRKRTESESAGTPWEMYHKNIVQPAGQQLYPIINPSYMYGGKHSGMPYPMGGGYQDNRTVKPMYMGGGNHYMQGGPHHYSGQHAGMPPMMAGMYQDQNTVKPMFAGGGPLMRSYGPYGMQAPQMPMGQQMQPQYMQGGMSPYQQMDGHVYMQGGKHSRLGPEEVYYTKGSIGGQYGVNQMTPGQMHRTTKYF
jgi:hypothetical protein